MQHISSRQNPIVARYRAARDREREIDPVLLDGMHLVSEALDHGAPLRDVVIADRAVERTEMRDLLGKLARARVDVKAAAPLVMSALSPVRSPSSVVALTDAPDLRDERAQRRLFEGKSPLAVIGYNIQDPGNIGAIIRVAEAAGATGVVVGTHSADPFGWKAVRGSMGSALRLPLMRDTVDGMAIARRCGCRIVAMMPRGGRSIYELDLTRATAIVIGGEGPGLGLDLLDDCDEQVTIPMRTPVESLNAAVTAAVVLYEAHRQRST